MAGVGEGVGRASQAVESAGASADAMAVEAADWLRKAAEAGSVDAKVLF